MGCKPLHRGAAGVHNDQLAAAFGELFEIGRRNRMVFRWVCANHDGHIRIFNLIEGCRNRARSNIFHQRRNR